ncbi:prephenate dehydrogenase [Propionibacterium cyclohexanicum]|uniref:Prephenate dehydrogenase n=1 Tax=Propionibacterium cyclohexanicum TaxID=64702 RepID=A0A1H9Q0A4_9ACTN|nr:prephenate dehydrogenase [Propionibacterium cyclohexanicum]SER54006.1 prephenate dehydrogenase [Propionibacterium cyclohexanicum]
MAGRDLSPIRAPQPASERQYAELDPVVVIGTGLVGASIGCALSAAGIQVHLRDRYRSHALVAAGLGAGTVSSAQNSAVKLVVVAVPPDAVPEVVERALARYRHAVVTDVASVKKPVMDALREAGVDLSRYVGSHPMAGSQYSGPLTASPHLFVDRRWVIADGSGSAQAVRRVEALVALCGARLIHLAPADHDRAVAEVSHVPQIMSSLTAARLREVPPPDLLLAGQGVRDVTRVAGSDPTLWGQIIAANRTEILTQLRAIRADLDQLLEGLGTNDPQAVTGLIAAGREGVSALPGKHGHPGSALDTVVVEIPDAPGALARLFAEIQAQGVNIEDLSIEHDLAKPAGYLSVAVEAGHAEALRAAMTASGWELRS